MLSLAEFCSIRKMMLWMDGEVRINSCSSSALVTHHCQEGESITLKELLSYSPGQSGRRQQRKFSLTQSVHVHIWACSTSYSLWTKEKLSPELLLLAYLLRNCFPCLLRTVFDCLNSTAKPRVLASCVPCLILLPFAIKSCINKPMPVPFFPVSALTTYYFLVLLSAHFFLRESRLRIVSCHAKKLLHAKHILDCSLLSLSVQRQELQRNLRKRRIPCSHGRKITECVELSSSVFSTTVKVVVPESLDSFWEEWSMISLFIYCVLPLQCRSLLQVITLTNCKVIIRRDNKFAYAEIKKNRFSTTLCILSQIKC